MKHDVLITFTVELTRDTDNGDSLDEDILIDVAFDQLIDDREDNSIQAQVIYC